MSNGQVSILDGNTFVVSDNKGDIEATPTDTAGLFSVDTRFLSRWILTLNGSRLSALSTDDLQYFSVQFFLVPGSASVYVDSPLSIVRKRSVGDGLHEEIIIENNSKDAIDLDIRLDAGSDFADLFEVKDALKKKGEFYTKTDEKKLVLGYKREKFIRETSIVPSIQGKIDKNGFTFKTNLKPHQKWQASFNITTSGPLNAASSVKTKYDQVDDTPKPNMGMSLKEWLDKAPKLKSSWNPLERIYERSLIDLAALRFYSYLYPGESLPAAGLPWFMAIFGRDSIITSFQALPFEPELAATTLRLLGARQGTMIDDFRDEEPGKILHEARLGEMTAFEERPHSPYFGTADATPLYLILLDEYEKWTGDKKLVKDLEKEARLALQWIDKYGDRDGDGYIEYDRRNKETGLENQCWKDSWDSIRFSDGSIAPLSRATCEIQGYAYDAKIRCARLAREIWNDPDLAKKLEKEAAELKKRFNKDFWLPKRKFFALALDGKKRQVDSLTSNIGHLLWSGIVEDDKIEPIVKHLMSDELFSGWGIRTMASSEGGYNPIGYHVGTVWPHDNSIIAAGLSKAGFKKEAARVAWGILDAATYFNYRLPEAFGGFPKEKTHFPVEYPTACSPQAWATGTPLLLISTLLGLKPANKKLLVDAVIPENIPDIKLSNITGVWGRTEAIGIGAV